MSAVYCVPGGGPHPCSAHGADHHRRACPVAEHVAEPCCLVVDLVQADADEIDEHQLGHRMEPGQRRSRRRTVWPAAGFVDTEIGCS